MTMTETFKGMILFGMVGPGITLNSNRIKADKAKNNTAVLNKIIEISKDDATKKRDSKQYQDYGQELGNKAGITDFYFNADVFQQQLDNYAITDEQLELFSPELVKQLKDARKEGLTGKVVKVSFGDTTGLSIKRDDPARRRSFRARHRCDTPGPKWKARYWSCYQWRAGAKVNN